MAAAQVGMGTDLRQLPDDELVQRMREGQVEALEVLYDRYARVVFSFAVRIVGDGLLAEEVLQEAFMRSWQQAGRFENARGSFPNWLLSITHNLAIDEVRKRQRRPQRADLVDIADVLRSEVDTTADVEETAEASELRERIRAAMATLPPAQQRVIELAYFEGLTQREIAALLNEPLGTIKTRMRLGMRKLKDVLGPQEEP
ncbi:sigma-70 family RNA polymerase sigma factor [Sphaerobacter sp.]|uniref:RNA polymerase sigma factor n=1 Tax=Sphaerobacter sp. TaxID=2099654 RepID=UPI0025E062A1|nr:sigma-70 family RNA polymerase sigma factor [Sphaerobacter sp.]